MAAAPKEQKSVHLLYSIGHGNRTAEGFLELLRSFHIEHLVDVRSYPGSRRNPHFNRESLARRLSQAGISYSWLPDLGGFRRKGLGTESPHLALESPGFRNYADHMSSPAFRAAVSRIRELLNTGPTCIMCAETSPYRCHRLLLSDYLWTQGIQVIHILDSRRTDDHQLSRHARVDGHQVIYDRFGPDQLKLEPS